MRNARERAASEAQAHFEEDELRRRLGEIRASAISELTDKLEQRIRHEDEFGPSRDTWGEPCPRPRPDAVESVCGAILLVMNKGSDKGDLLGSESGSGPEELPETP